MSCRLPVSWLSSDQDVELSASPAPYLSALYHVSCYDNGLTSETESKPQLNVYLYNS